MRKHVILKYKGFHINLGDRNNMEQFSNNRAAFSQVFLQGTYDSLLKKLKAGDSVIDAGANIGMFTLQAARIVGPSGMVIAVEPQPDNIEFLKENIRLNSLTNVKVITRALYFENDLAVSFAGKGVGGHLSKSGSITVETISLKTVVSLLSGKDFLIKMDIEGGEEFIFARDQDLSYLKGLKGIAYEIHSTKGMILLNARFNEIGLKPSPVYLERDFAKKVIIAFIKHPILVIRLYRSFLLRLSLRILKKRNPPVDSDHGFEPGMQYAFRE